MEGIIVINKPPEYTSFDVIARLKGMSKMKKVGHSGTLDPMATGVLPVFFGRATKACDMLPDDKKEYIAEFVFGKTSNTLDIYGELQEGRIRNVTKGEILENIPPFIGEIKQLPPMFSAVRINGQRLYDIARTGVEVERTPRDVTIHEIELIDFCFENQKGSMRILCSKGTYIRTLCKDLGDSLGVDCIMGNLVRTISNGFSLEQSITLDEAQTLTHEGRLHEAITPIEEIFKEYTKLYLSEKQAKMMMCGVSLDLDRIRYKKGKDIYSIYDHDNNFLALGKECADDNSLMIIKRFAL